MLYFVNPAQSRRKGRTVKKRRTAAQRRATAKMIAANKRRRRGYVGNPKRKGKKRGVARKSTTRKRSTIMAAKRKTGKKSTRRTSKKRRSPISRLRRNTVYVTNPRRRRVSRRGRRRNPPIMRAAIQTAQDSAAVLVGTAAGRTIGGMLPSFGNPVADAAKGVLVAIGVRMIAGRFLGGEVARFAAAGAMQVPLKNLIVGFVPQAANFLGAYDEPGALSSYADVAGYLDAGEAEEVEVSSYSDAYGGM